MKLTADNLCACIIIVAMVANWTQAVINAVGVNGLAVLVLLGLSAYYQYSKARRP